MGLQASLYGLMVSKICSMAVARCLKSVSAHRCTPLEQASVALKRSKCSWNIFWRSSCSASLGVACGVRAGAISYKVGERL